MCGGKFTLRHLTLERVLTLTLVTPCPYCDARPRIASGTYSDEHSTVHRIFDLREESDATYRKTPTGDTWHFTQSCSRWPSGDYLELDLLPSVGDLCIECRTIKGNQGNR
jgi:hypothetical protein